MLEFAPLADAEAPISTIIPDLLHHSIPPSPANYVNEPIEPAKLDSDLTKQLKSTHYNDKAMPKIPQNTLEKQINNSTKNKCNIFDGRWVYKPGENPNYDTRRCSFIEEKMSCQKNGRPDFEYEKWRWEAKDCDIPLFNGRDMLERLRNKRVIIVGDSLNRNMWESLACLLYSSVSPSRAEVNDKSSHYKVFKAKDYNTILEFHWSPFLVEFDIKHRSGKKVLMLDKLSSNSQQWLGADVMVFNSGHWWTHTGTFKKWDLLQHNGKLMEGMPVAYAYELGMKTWAKWIKENVDPMKTNVFFRSISAQHNGRTGCYNVTQPLMDESYINHYPKSMVNVIESLITGMSKIKVKYLNITKLSEYRIDAHPSVYRSSWKWKIYTSKYQRLIPSYADCSHWCLPGLPDTWNRLFYVSLFFDGFGNKSS
ncbi:hypothetical protein BVRB_9g225270 [Beta vulgaris subsp. vulgaris]|uniref:Uncharacterized protein n=1 Tax=Beta vulgaris subsp. vulgaris TaxID=3555 RepID=A0A0J8B991_BETVV|nr:hypothetical protein BVRB_9g225270 [Beta vulgaris subsp. vulgaris]